MFSLYKKIRNLDLPIDFQLKLIDNTIVPILTYGCEVWGYGKEYKWLSNVKSIFDETGMSYIWFNQKFTGSKCLLLKTLGISMCNQYVQKWRSDVDSLTKCLNYKMYNIDHCFKPYLCLLSDKYLKTFVNFRLCNNLLPIERGRYYSK
jgi:hypothetical protein